MTRAPAARVPAWKIRIARCATVFPFYWKTHTQEYGEPFRYSPVTRVFRILWWRLEIIHYTQTRTEEQAYAKFFRPQDMDSLRSKDTTS